MRVYLVDGVIVAPDLTIRRLDQLGLEGGLSIDTYHEAYEVQRAFKSRAFLLTLPTE